MSGYRLIALDIDGTLAMPGTEVSEDTTEVLRTCAARGVRVVLATGKRFESIEPLMRRLGLSGACITCNGAMTIRAADHALLVSELLEPSQARGVLDDLAARDLANVAVFTDREIVLAGRNFAWEQLENVYRERPLRVVDDLRAAAGGKVAKILVAVPGEDRIREAFQSLARRWADELTVTLTTSVFFEFHRPEASKGRALRRLAGQEGISMEQVMAIGDHDNDRDMLAASGLGVAVANATDAAKAAADVTVASCADGGVAEAVRRYVLEA